MGFKRRIAHLDMDAFYASVELLRYPMLKGEPVVIGGSRNAAPRVSATGQWTFSRLRNHQGRGVVTTATYPARDFGIRSGMPLREAAARCPDAMLLPVDFEAYRKASHMFKVTVAEIAPLIEDRGIDEIYIDLSRVAIPGLPSVAEDDGFATAALIKSRIRERCGLSCSIGITPNKLLSKIASELDKPDGLTILTESNWRDRIWPLDASRINGIGPKAYSKLKELGVESIADLAHAEPARLKAAFGPKYAEWLIQSAQGLDDRPIVTESEPKSISRETTFERDLHPKQHRMELGAKFVDLCENLSNTLKRKGYVAGSIGVKLRFEDFRTVTRDQSLDSPIDDAESIRRVASACIRRIPLDRRIRLMGIKAGQLSDRGQRLQAELGWSEPSDDGDSARKALESIHGGRDTRRLEG